MRRRLFWAALALVWFGTAHLYPLLEPDEGRYAEIPREMAASGDWVTPRLDGFKYFEKPPLQYWATATLYNLFGVNEWTARAWSLGLSFLCLPLIFFWTQRMYGERAALAALAVLAASPAFILIGHLNLLDGAFTFWLTSTVLAFVSAQIAPLGSRNERNWMLVAWLAAALAVLSKGIVVIVLAGLTLVLYSGVQRDWQAWRRLHWSTGLPLFLLVAAPWFIAVSQANPEFARFFFLHEHFARFFSTVHQRAAPFWFFLPLAVLALLPWLADLHGAVRQTWRQNPDADRFNPLRFFLLYAAVVLGLFSLSQSKLPPYILPMLPVLAVIIGVYVAAHPGALRRAAWISAAGVVMVAGGLVVYSLRRHDAAPSQLVGWATVAAGIAMLAALNIRASHPPWRNALLLASASMLAWQALIVSYAAPPLTRSARSLVEIVRPYIEEGAPLYNVGQYRQTMPVYLGRTVTLVAYRGELEFGMQHEPGHRSATLEEFKGMWLRQPKAIAFFEPSIWSALVSEGVPGRVIASDRYSLAVRRQ